MVRAGVKPPTLSFIYIANLSLLVARRIVDRQKPKNSRCPFCKTIDTFLAQSEKQSNLQGCQTLKNEKNYILN